MLNMNDTPGKIKAKDLIKLIHLWFFEFCIIICAKCLMNFRGEYVNDVLVLFECKWVGCILIGDRWESEWFNYPGFRAFLGGGCIIKYFQMDLQNSQHPFKFQTKKTHLHKSTQSVSQQKNCYKKSTT